MDAKPQDDSHPFQCGICLELVFKPIVHACGHVFCFWCVHFAMRNRDVVSYCPMCRSPYKHFPRICEMLHHLLVKIFPKEYEERGEEVRKEEMETRMFSPELENATGSVEVSDLLCNFCKQLIYRPVVLNCGHAFCQTCLPDLDKCSSCGMSNRINPLQVCLELHEYLEKTFPDQLKQREAELNKKIEEKKLVSSTGSSDRGKERAEPETEGGISPVPIHFGVGCDVCGEYPIHGTRYRCRDCDEASGYDLCEECYADGSVVVGRFNQRHTKEHRMEKIVGGPRFIRIHGQLLIGVEAEIAEAEGEVLETETEEAPVEAQGEAHGLGTLNLLE